MSLEASKFLKFAMNKSFSNSIPFLMFRVFLLCGRLFRAFNYFTFIRKPKDENGVRVQLNFALNYI